MPTISTFYGIVIRMFVKDHPPPHFHVVYGEHRARVSIASGEALEGELPRRGTLGSFCSTDQRPTAQLSSTPA